MVIAPDLAQAVADFADTGVVFDSGEDARQQVLGPVGGFLDLMAFHHSVECQRRNCLISFDLKLIDTDDDRIFCLGLGIVAAKSAAGDLPKRLIRAVMPPKDPRDTAYRPSGSRLTPPGAAACSRPARALEQLRDRSTD